jgi:hypothetical protein
MIKKLPISLNVLWGIFILFFSAGFNQSMAQTPSNLVQDYLNANGGSFGLNQNDISDWSVSSDHVSNVSGIHHIYFNQQYDGIEVMKSNSSLHIFNGNPLLSHISFIGNLASKISGVNPTPGMTSRQAIAAAAAHYGLTINNPLVLLDSIGGPSLEVKVDKGSVSLEDIPVKLVYHPVTADSLVLAWDLSIYEPSQENWWSVRVDATTGTILDEVNWVVSCTWDGDHSCHDHEAPINKFETTLESTAKREAASQMMVGSYNVFPIPTETPGHGPRVLVANPDDPTASPFGWHDIDGIAGPEYTITRGNNAHAYDDGDNPGFSPDGGPGLVFDFPLNLTYSAGDPSEAAAITNLFYWNNIIHDMMYQYGFDEAAGNFQENNYGNGGSGSDYVNAEAQDGSGTCNANFGTPSDGNNPRMQMYVCNSRDGDLDNMVIVHEYAHGISNRLTGGRFAAGCLNNQEQMGEGWSDYFGLVMTMKATDLATDARGVGTWLFGQPPTGGGIRPWPYTTNLAVNPETYDDIKTLSVPHGVGTVWCAMLWEMTWALIDQYGFSSDLYNGTAGNNIAIRLVMEGMKLQPCSPGFVDGRDAILAADMALYGGANQCLIWEAFAKRGLGFSANQGSTGSRSDGTEAFDLPPACSGICDLNITNTSSTDASCAGSNDGTINVTATSSFPPISYSIAGPVNQSNATGVFTGLPNGSYTVTVTDAFGMGCSDNAMVTVGVGMDNTPPTAVCQDGSVTLNGAGNGTINAASLDGGSTDNCSVVFTYSVNPSTANCSNVGPLPVVLTVIDGSNNSDNCNATVDVIASQACTPPAITNMGGPNISDPCTCLGDGRFAEEVVIGPANPGLEWVVGTTTLINPATGSAYAAGTPFVESPAPGNPGQSIYTLQGEHLDGVGYTLTATSRFFPGQPLSISNTCFYPEAGINAFGGPFCLNTPPVTFTGFELSGAEGTGQFFINGTPVTTTENPVGSGNYEATVDVSTLGIGSHTLVFEFDAGNPAGLLNPANIGCIESIETSFQVVETPSNITCNDLVQISLDEDCSVDVLPDMLLEGTYLCYDDYSVTFKDHGRNILNPLNASHIGRVITATVTHIPSGNTCWSSVTVEDKWAPEFICPTAPIVLDCTQDPDDVPVPTAVDNCDIGLTINLIDEVESGDDCDVITITRTFIATDLSNNTSEPCTQTIEIQASLLTFPDDVTWTCEQYAFNSGIINPTALHPGILENAGIIDLADYCCVPGLDGDDVAGVAPYQAGTEWWTDGEDLDVSLDPNYDDILDNPLTDPNTTICGTVSPETDNFGDVYNLSAFVGCPAYDECEITGLHTPTFVNIPVYAPFDPITGLPIRGLEDADILEQTGSGVPNVLGHSDCRFAITYHDVKLEACEGVDTSVVFKILRTWTALNWCTGETFTDVQVIKVLDKKAPEIVFNDDDDTDGIPDETETNERYGNDDGYNDQIFSNEYTAGPHPVCGSHGLLDVPEYLDNCSGVVEVRVFTPVGEATAVEDTNGEVIGYRIPSPYLPIGIHTVNYTITDGCGNMTSVDKRIEVIDGIPPIPICREVTQVALTGDEDGLTIVGAEFFDEGSYDNCGPVYFKVRRMDDNCDGYPNDRNRFNDDIRFCCMDVGQTVNVILRVYDVEPNPGSVTQNYLVPTFNTNDCMIEVLVEDKVRPTCVAPDDVWTTCADIPANVDLSDTTQLQNLFGNADGLDNCTFNTEELSPIVDVDICGVGQVRRRFRTRDASGNISIGTCQQVVMIMEVHGYEIDIPGDFEDECTTVSPDTLDYREIGCDLLAVNLKEEEFPASAGGECKKILRTYKIINWCEYDGVSAPTIVPRVDLNRDGIPGDGFTPSNPGSKSRANYRLISNGDYVYLNIINDPVTRYLPSTGYYQYEQHIKIFDDTAPELTDTLSGPFCGGDLDEDPCTGEVDLIPEIVETCTDVTVSWQLDAFNDVFQTADFSGDDNLTGRYPLGIHTARFRVSDDCGNTSQIDITFEIIDCKAPTPVCHNGLSIDLMPSGMVEVWATDFDASSYDYCHPLKFRINRIEDRNGDGFITPDDYINTPPTTDSVVFRCKDLGITYVQLWVGEESTDNVNNWDYCVTFMEVQDNLGACTGSKSSIGGKIATSQNVPVDKVELTLNTGASAMTGNDGAYNFEDLNLGQDFTVTPYRNDDFRNGVSTFDLVLISKHILNVQKFTDPYKLIAADANNSGSVTTLDLVSLRKLILFVSNDLPNNTSWRFVNKAYQFADPLNPWNAQEVYSVNDLATRVINADFVAIKVGDVTGDARANSAQSVGNRSFNNSVKIKTQTETLKAGEKTRVEFKATKDVNGIQFTLNLDTDKIKLMDIENGLSEDNMLNFNVFENEGIITYSWNGDISTKNKSLFTLELIANSDVEISDVVSITSEMTAAEAYTPDGAFLNVEFENNKSSLLDGYALYQNVPNPFAQSSFIQFELPEDAVSVITISDISGKVVKVIKGDFNKGLNQIELKDKDFPGAGIYTYRLSSGNFTATRKLVKL